jgi:4-amino-4-deoxy-L-arabinose transferase-like glycosyltransferase
MNQSLPFGRLLGLILILDAAILLPVLGRAALSRIDEGQIGEVSHEMATGRDWVTPRIGEIPFPAYPPLAYWIFASSGSAFGFNEFALRLPTALAALALIAIVANLTRRLAGAEAGLAAAVCLAALPAFFLQSAVCRADLITLAFAIAAFDRFLAWADVPAEALAEAGAGRRNRDLALMYLFTALGILAKGPLAVALLGLGGLAWFLLRREWKLLLAMKFWIGVPAALVIVVPWYYAVYRINGWAFLHENLFLENLKAYGDGYQQPRPLYFYFKQAPLLLPWLLALPFCWKARRAPGVILSWAWFGLVALFFTLSAAKRINYLAYFTPPLAMASGTTLAALWAESPRILRNGVLGLAGVLLAGSAVIAALPASVWTGDNVVKIAPQLPTLAACAGAAAIAVAAIAGRFGPREACAGAAAFMLAGFFAYGFFFNPLLSQENRETADFCRRAASRVPAGEKLCVPAPEGAEGQFHFYAGGPLPLKTGPGYFLASQAQEEKMEKDGRAVQILDRMLDQRGRYRYLLRVHP